MKKTLFLFFKDHILTQKKQLLVLFLSGILIYIKTRTKIKQQSIMNSINNPKAPNIKNKTDLAYFITISVVYITSVPSLELVANSFETSILKSVFTSSYAEFLQYKFNDWSNTLQGDLYSIIIRRSMAVAKFFKHAFFDASDTFCYIFICTFKLIFEYGLLTHFKYGLAFLAFFPIFSNGLSKIRNLIQRKSNDAYDQGEKTLKDIFLNYEMIHTYNTLEKEIQNYKRDMRNAKFWFFMYWLCNDVIDLVNKLAKMMLIAIVFDKIDLKTTEPRDVFKQMTAFQSVSKRMNSFIENIKKVVEASENAFYCKLDFLEIEKTDHLLAKDSFDSQIEIKSMAKHYGENLVYKDLNFTIKKGEKVAITGVNGSGKSSFIKSLVGLEKYEGNILIDDTNIAALRESSQRELLTYVPQDSSIFDATLYDNLTSFNSKITPETVFFLVHQYGMDADFKEIGYDTMLVDDSRNLSSAQRQKISFMRAVIRDTPIVLLDEVTSEMDKEYEATLVKSILSNMTNKTVIMIIHNLDLLPMFDKVIFFNNHTSSACLSLKELLLNNNSKEFNDYYSASYQISK